MTREASLTTTTKKNLAQAVADATGTTKLTALHMVDSLFETMCEMLSDGRRIEIRGFGAFSVKATKPKPAARNPKTGEIVYVPARRKTHFKPGKVLLEAMHVSRE
jgi:integration host factor subunit beta